LDASGFGLIHKPFITIQFGSILNHEHSYTGGSMLLLEGALAHPQILKFIPIILLLLILHPFKFFSLHHLHSSLSQVNIL
jgi:hypothetical protein